MLSDAEKSKYARQILLNELGTSGQERLCSTAFALSEAADPRAAVVARDYLERAGVGVRANPKAPLAVSVASTEEVSRIAGDVALEACAAWLLGAHAAVEAIKAIAGAGSPAQFPDAFVLASEVR